MQSACIEEQFELLLPLSELQWAELAWFETVPDFHGFAEWSCRGVGLFEGVA